MSTPRVNGHRVGGSSRAVQPERDRVPPQQSAGHSPEDSSDLWSLPAQEPGPPSDESLLAAWLGALARTDLADTGAGTAGQGSSGGAGARGTVTVTGSLAAAGAMTATGPVAAVALADSGSAALPTATRPWLVPSPRSLLVTGLICLAFGVLVALLGPPLAARLTGSSPDAAADSVTPAGADGRVVRPGQDPGCPLVLVKPRDDGTTVGVPGTCFAIG